MSSAEPSIQQDAGIDIQFQRSPLVERILAVQFEPIQGLTNAHLGWFWRELGPSWPKPLTVPALPDQREVFDPETAWQRQGLSLSVRVGEDPIRLQVAHEQDDRVIQLQPTRFMYNWRRRQGDYPRHEALLREFLEQLGRLQAFLGGARLGEIRQNQWELTYVNQILRGEGWDSPRDWTSILPALLGHGRSGAGLEFESVSGEWHFAIQPLAGRLHVSVQHARLLAGPGTEVLVLQLTARGPIREEAGWSLQEGLERGHQMCQAAFIELTSPEMQQRWGRTR